MYYGQMSSSITNVYAHWAQSNGVLALPDPNDPIEAKYFNPSPNFNYWERTTQEYKVMSYPNLDFLQPSSAKGYFNKEWSMAYELKVGEFFKYAINGSSLLNDWQEGSTYRTAYQVETKKLVDILIADNKKIQVNTGQDQWEADSASDYQTYYDALVDFYDSFELNVHEIHSYVFTKPNKNSPSYVVATELGVEKAIIDFAATKKRAIVIDFNDITAGLDSGLHYTAQQNVVRGQRYAAAYKQLI